MPISLTPSRSTQGPSQSIDLTAINKAIATLAANETIDDAAVAALEQLVKAIDLTPYAKTTEMEQAIAAIPIPKEPDLTPYAKAADVKTSNLAISSLTSDTEDAIDLVGQRISAEELSRKAADKTQKTALDDEAIARAAADETKADKTALKALEDATALIVGKYKAADTALGERITTLDTAKVNKTDPYLNIPTIQAGLDGITDLTGLAKPHNIHINSNRYRITWDVTSAEDGTWHYVMNVGAKDHDIRFAGMAGLFLRNGTANETVNSSDLDIKAGESWLIHVTNNSGSRFVNCARMGGTTTSAIADNSGLTALETAYKAADTALGFRVGSLDTAYKAADTALGGQIDAINAKFVEPDLSDWTNAGGNTALNILIPNHPGATPNTLSFKLYDRRSDLTGARTKAISIPFSYFAHGAGTGWSAWIDTAYPVALYQDVTMPDNSVYRIHLHFFQSPLGLSIRFEDTHASNNNTYGAIGEIKATYTRNVLNNIVAAPADSAILTTRNITGSINAKGYDRATLPYQISLSPGSILARVSLNGVATTDFDPYTGIVRITPNGVDIAVTHTTAQNATFSGLQRADYTATALSISTSNQNYAVGTVLREGDLLEVQHEFNGNISERQLVWVRVQAGSTQRNFPWADPTNNTHYWTFPSPLTNTFQVRQAGAGASPKIISVKVWRDALNGYVVPSGYVTRQTCQLTASGATFSDGSSIASLPTDTGQYIGFTIPNGKVLQSVSSSNANVVLGASDPKAGTVFVTIGNGATGATLTPIFVTAIARSLFTTFNSGSWVTFGSLAWTIPTSGNRSLQVRSASGTVTVKWLTWLNWDTTADPATYTATITASSAQYLVASWSFGNYGNRHTAIIEDVTNSRRYRVDLAIGASYNNNVLAIEEIS